jgi:hypothetical protein
MLHIWFFAVGACTPDIDSSIAIGEVSNLRAKSASSLAAWLARKLQGRRPGPR